MRRCGFSLIELLVVISIIAVLAGMLLPATGLVRSQAQSMVCSSCLRQVGMATMAYAEDNGGLLADIVVIPASGGSVRWADLIADYADTPLQGQTVAYARTSVLTGCPEWTSTGAWLLGYGMNINPDQPARMAASSRWDYRLATPDPDVVHFSLAGITYKSSRLLIADASDYHAVISLTRHRDRFNANALFFDGHVQSLRGAAQATAIKSNPAVGAP